MSSTDPSPESFPEASYPPEAFTPSPPAASGGDGFLPPLPFGAAKPHPGFWWAVLWCIGFVLCTQIPPGIFSAVVMVVMGVFLPGSFPNGPGTTPGDLLNSTAGRYGTMAAFVLAEILVIGISFLVIRLAVGRNWTRQLALRRPGTYHTVLALLSFPALVLLGNGAYTAIRRVLPSISDLGVPGMEQMSTVFGSWPWPVAVLLIGVGPGVGEELWCRGFLGRGLVGRYGAVVGILFSSFFFGLIHLDPCQGTMAMLMGFWLHFVYLTGRSLWLPIMLHFLNNSLAVVSHRIPGLSVIEEAPENLPLLVYGGAGLLMAAVGWALYCSRARVAGADGGPAPWQPPFPGVMYPPQGSGSVVYRPRPDASGVIATVAGVATFAAACYVAWPSG